MKKLLFSLSIGLIAFTLNAQSLKINDPFFTHVDYIGAFDGMNDWTSGWANWSPENAVYPEPTVTKGNGNEDLITSLHIAADETWSGVIKLDGWVYVDEPAVLTISPGTIIRGEAKSAIIIQRGAKIHAEGTSTDPIVFTSAQGEGFRANSDWAGLIVCGKGINNIAGGLGLTEGGTGVNHGGTDNTDNSGVIKYVRIEFPGYMVSEGNEINGLSLASVGSGTTIEYVQVSNSGDDGFEFWGGAVNAKHLISYRTEDDDFDTDNGFIGMIQFGVVARDYNIVDTDAANGFESDNDPSGTNAMPRTNPTFSNFSLFGPSATSTDPETLLPNHASGNSMRIRRGSALQVYNSVFAGWANGLLIESSNGWSAAQTDSLTVQYTNIAGVRTSWFKAGSGLTVPDVEAWFNAPARHNDTTLVSTSLKISDPFNYSARNFQPMDGSPVFNASIWYVEPVSAEFPIDFEIKTDAIWNVFANGVGDPSDFMVIANPDKSGINTSDKVLKFVVNDGAETYAGASSDSYAPVEFTQSSHTVTMMVWKSVISPVAFKVEGSTNGGPVKEIKVSNTLTEQWEMLTFDLSDCIGFSYPRIVIFPDFPATRTSGSTSYIDNISRKVTTTVVDIIVNSPDHSTLETAVIAAGLADDLSGTGPFTVFAPTNAAFDALPAGVLEGLLEDPTGDLAQILLYHVASGKVMSTDLSDGQMIMTLQGKEVTVDINIDGVFINGAKVTTADLTADNGVVHVIDAVLLPPAPTTVVDIIVNSPDHSTLETAVIAAGLDDDLSGTGPFTVFAPTNAAFDALPAGVLDALLADPTGDLAQILLYHVASGKVMSTDLSNGQSIITLQGKNVTVEINTDGVFINGAEVTVADLSADNGVVHVIDAVLLPPTGIAKNISAENQLRIYPNPAVDVLNVFLSSANAKVTIYNSLGSIVESAIVEGTKAQFDISSYSRGIYFVKVNNDSVVKFVK